MAKALRRLGPGELDGLVLSYLCKHEGEGPLSTPTIAKGLGGRSAGAVANCLVRLVRQRKVRRVDDRPRRSVVAKGRW
jgi:hypothetical protein